MNNYLDFANAQDISSLNNSNYEACMQLVYALFMFNTFTQTDFRYTQTFYKGIIMCITYSH